MLTLIRQSECIGLPCTIMEGRGVKYMLKMSDIPIRKFLPFFANAGLQVAFLVPTPIGYQKSIMDATIPLREMLRETGIHNYTEQEQGPKFKKLVKTYFLTPDRMIETEASLYRPITKQGDPRIWFYNLKQYCMPCNLLAVLSNKEKLYVLNLSNAEIVESMNFGFIREVIQQFVDDDSAIAKEYFRYDRIVHTKNPNVSLFPQLIDEGIITVDYIMHRKENGTVRDHGFPFKIFPKDLNLLFPEPKIYELD